MDGWMQTMFVRVFVRHEHILVGVLFPHMNIYLHFYKCAVKSYSERKENFKMFNINDSLIHSSDKIHLNLNIYENIH